MTPAQISLQAILDRHAIQRSHNRSTTAPATITTLQRTPAEVLEMRIQNLWLLPHCSLSPRLQDSIVSVLEARRLYLTSSRSIPKLPRFWGHELALELLELIFGHLIDDIDTLRTVRLTCRSFERAAWPVYAASFNNYVFHLTTSSLKLLQDLAFQQAVAPYLKQLRISTVKLVQAGPRSTWATYHADCARFSTMLNRPGVQFPHNPAQLQWIKESEERKRLTKMLRVALRQLERLEDIVPVDDDLLFSCLESTRDGILEEQEVSALCKAGPITRLSVRQWLTLKRTMVPGQIRGQYMNKVRTNQMAQAAGWYTASGHEESHGWLFERKAHRHTLDVIYQAIQSTPQRLKTKGTLLPNLRELKMQGRISIASLWGCPYGIPGTNRICCPPLLQLERLELSVTNWHQRHTIEEMSKDIRHYIPDFLSTMPNLTHLTLDFLPTWYVASIEEVAHFTDLVISALTFSTAIAPPLNFRRLTHLHLLRAKISDMQAFQTFLLRHRSTLTSLTMTTVTTFENWWRLLDSFLPNMALQECVYIFERVRRGELAEVVARVDEVREEYLSTWEELDAVSKTGLTWVDRVVDADGRLVEEKRYPWPWMEK